MAAIRFDSDSFDGSGECSWIATSPRSMVRGAGGADDSPNFTSGNHLSHSRTVFTVPAGMAASALNMAHFFAFESSAGPRTNPPWCVIAFKMTAGSAVSSLYASWSKCGRSFWHLSVLPMNGLPQNIHVLHLRQSGFGVLPHDSRPFSLAFDIISGSTTNGRSCGPADGTPPGAPDSAPARMSPSIVLETIVLTSAELTPCAD